MIDVAIPAPVRNNLEDISNKLKDNARYLVYNDIELMFNSRRTRDYLFKETCNVVYETIRKVLNNTGTKGLKNVVLVGGFAESPIVIDNIRQMIVKDFPETKVVVPPSPFKAVLKGAVLFGHDPLICRSRFTRETFGEKLHYASKKWKHKETDEDWCKDIFSLNVRKGQSAILGDKQPVKSNCPVYENQTQMRLPNYTATSLNPKYIHEDPCIHFPDATVGTKRKFDSMIKGPKLVIALDIGSTYSGYAWQSRDEFETNRNEIHFNTNWGGGALQLHKTTTCMLLECQKNEEGAIDQRQPDLARSVSSIKLDVNDSGMKVKIGHEAERVYSGIAKQKQDPGELDGQYYFFKRFKLLLYNEGFHKELLVEDQIGQRLPLFDVMSLFIKALKDHCLKKLKTQGITVDMNKTLFVVTVPAIWKDEAKKFMRDAAIAAGISKRNVLLALEPEAAAIYCLHLPEGQRKEMNDLGMKGQKFLVADLGGGTADLSAVEVDTTGQLKEICPPLGDPVGGQKINEAFLQVCHDSFEGQGWKETFSRATPVEMLKMDADFERKKVTIGSEDEDAEMIDIEIPAPVRDKLEDKTIRLKDNTYLAFENRELMFNSRYIRDNLFKETCQVVYGTIKKVLDNTETKGLKTVVLVGGFAESPIVIENIRQMIVKDFPETKVVIPSSPFKAVLKGAVLFGQDPLIFRSRISRETFGIATNSLFDENVHDVAKKWKHKDTGKDYCKDIFSLHVRKGQSVVLGDKQPVKSYFPLYENQTQMRFPIYTATSLNPKYTTEDGCKHIGDITVDIPDTTGGTKRECEVSMIYGGTELSVIAKDKTTEKEFNADIQFCNM